MMLDIDEDAWIPRKDGRIPTDQIHDFYRVERIDGPDLEFRKIPDPNGNVKMTIRVGELIDWLENFGPSTPVVVDLTGVDGPENGDSALFEAMTAYDDPDPYTTIVVRSTHA